MKKSTLPVLAFFIAFAALASCGPAASSAQRAGRISEQPSIAPISALPPGTDERPLQPGQSGTEYMPNGLPALAPARGVNADTMFAEKMSNDDARFRRLENAVADMRREFEAVKPAIVRLTAVESDMEDLVTQLQTLIPGSGGTTRDIPPPSRGARANINDDMQIPDIGPMEEEQSNELLETKAPPKKSAKLKPDEKIAALEMPSPPKAQKEKAVSAPVSTGPPKNPPPVKTEIVKTKTETSQPAEKQAAKAVAPEKTAEKTPSLKITPAAPAPVQAETPPPLKITPQEKTGVSKTAAESEAMEKALIGRSLLKKAPAEKIVVVPVQAAPEKIVPEKTPEKIAIVNPAPVVAAPPAPMTPVVQGPSSVSGLRVGEHAGATRIVIDASAKTKFTYDLDNSEHILMIELPKAAWSAARNGVATSPLVTSWTASESGAGVIVAIALKNNAEVVNASSLNAGKGEPFRIFFDLKKSP